jgi:hypothetical protein
MKTEIYENHRNRHMTAQDIQNEIELLRRMAAMRGPLNRRRITLDHYVGYGLLATALIVPAIAAAILILL